MKTNYETKQANISAYKVFWVEFRPERGIVPKSDATKIDPINEYINRDVLNFGRCYYKHFGSEAQARAFLTGFDKKLSKRYECRLLTDKQFGMRNEADGYQVHFTEKQNKEVYVLG